MLAHIRTCIKSNSNVFESGVKAAREQEARQDAEHIVCMPEQLFKDAKGKITKKAVNRFVSENFSEHTVETYMAFLENLVSEKSAAMKIDTTKTRTAIVLTSELNNFVRTGLR